MSDCLLGEGGGSMGEGKGRGGEEAKKWWGGVTEGNKRLFIR